MDIVKIKCPIMVEHIALNCSQPIPKIEILIGFENQGYPQFIMCPEVKEGKCRIRQEKCCFCKWESVQ